MKERMSELISHLYVWANIFEYVYECLSPIILDNWSWILIVGRNKGDEDPTLAMDSPVPKKAGVSYATVFAYLRFVDFHTTIEYLVHFDSEIHAHLTLMRSVRSSELFFYGHNFHLLDPDFLFMGPKLSRIRSGGCCA